MPPYLIATLFAGDRYTAKQAILSALEESDVVICDRFVASNLAHQGAKLPANERMAFFDWIAEIEFGIYAMPKPELNIFLNIPVQVASSLIQKKSKRSYTDLVSDFTRKT